MNGSGENESKRLFRSQSERMILGVCGGIARYLEVDATVVRILWMLAVLFFGLGIPLYFAAAIIIPKDPREAEQGSPGRTRSHDWNLTIGVVFLVLGAVLIMEDFHVFSFRFFHFNFFPWRLFWPFLLIGLGIYLLNCGTALSETVDRIKHEAAGRRLFRSRRDKMLFGVCGGLGASFNIDPTIVRLVWAALTAATGGAGILVYVVLAIIMPTGEADAAKENNGAGSGTSRA